MLLREIRSPKKGERYFALQKVTKLNKEALSNSRHRRTNFDNLTPLYPQEKINLEFQNSR